VEGLVAARGWGDACGAAAHGSKGTGLPPGEVEAGPPAAGLEAAGRARRSGPGSGSCTSTARAIGSSGESPGTLRVRAAGRAAAGGAAGAGAAAGGGSAMGRPVSSICALRMVPPAPGGDGRGTAGAVGALRAGEGAGADGAFAGAARGGGSGTEPVEPPAADGGAEVAGGRAAAGAGAGGCGTAGRAGAGRATDSARMVVPVLERASGSGAAPAGRAGAGSGTEPVPPAAGAPGTEAIWTWITFPQWQR
jgi:hypothetical protein